VTHIVIDASVTLSWCFADEQTAMSMAVLDRLQGGEQVLVPAFWALEVLNTLLVGERRGRIMPEQTGLFFDTLRVLNPTFDYASLDQVAGPVQIICRDSPDSLRRPVHRTRPTVPLPAGDFGSAAKICCKLAWRSLLVNGPHILAHHG
jgi:hypothetical protein